MARRQLGISAAIVCVTIALLLWFLGVGPFERTGPSSDAKSGEKSSHTEASFSGHDLELDPDEDASSADDRSGEDLGSAESEIATLPPEDPAAALLEGLSARATPPAPPPAVRFTVNYGRYQPPGVSGARYWRVIAHRELLSGCQPLAASTIGSPLSPLAYRVDLPLPPSPTTDGRGDSAIELDPNTPISIALFLALVPFDRDDQLIPGQVEILAGEVHTTVGIVQEDSSVSLVRSSSGSDFTVVFLSEKDSTPELAGASFDYSGNFGHVATRGRGPWSEWSGEFEHLFPEQAAPFLTETGFLPFAPAAFSFTTDTRHKVRFFNWADGLTLPLRIRAPGQSGPYEFAGHSPHLEIFSAFETGVIPEEAARLEYRLRVPSEFPPIEFSRGEPTEGFVLIEEPHLSAIARYSEEHEEWRWEVLSSGVLAPSMPFRAQWIAPGYRLATARGALGNQRPLRFRVAKSRGSETIEHRVRIDPHRQVDVPVIAELSITIEERAVKTSLRLIARSGRMTIPIDRQLLPASLAVDLDLPAMTRDLRARYEKRWGQAFEPIWLRGEKIAQEEDSTEFEVSVQSERQSWGLVEFIDLFQLR